MGPGALIASRAPTFRAWRYLAGLVGYWTLAPGRRPGNMCECRERVTC
jgi:hypothetical protein